MIKEKGGFMKEQFDKILDNDESVIKVYKPNKKRFYLANGFVFFLIWIVILTIVTLAVFLPDSEGENLPIYALYVTLGVFGASIVVNYFLAHLTYVKKLFAYTNKRIIIQSGTIGVDYKSLDLVMIGATEVRVDLLDKMIKNNTGTIGFGSMSSPINQTAKMFSFYGIENPYEVYKEIKLYIDEIKEK